MTDADKGKGVGSLIARMQALSDNLREHRHMRHDTQDAFADDLDEVVILLRLASA